jgi:anthranilate synthase component 1
VRFQTGAGIVADSDPQHEYEETLHKAVGLRRALEGLLGQAAAQRP